MHRQYKPTFAIALTGILHRENSHPMKTTLSLLVFLLLASPLIAQEQAPVETPLPVTETTANPEIPVPAEVEVPVVADPTFMERYIHDRLEIGTRITSASVDETKRGDSETREGTYFGSINEMKVEEESGPTKWFLQYRLHTYVGVGMTFDELTLVTKDGPSEANTDGDFSIDSSYYYIYLRYPLPYGFVPYIEYGRGSHDVSFSPESNWSRRNSIYVYDSSVDATFYSIGLEYHISRNFSVHVMQRWTDYSFDAEWRNIDGRTPTRFTVNMDQSVTGFGVKYTF
jgi:hypothetical protein